MIKLNTQHRAKKSLGQNFLKSIPALNKIIEVGEITDQDIVLEIGPGKGVLTAKLLENAETVIAVEKDRELLELLKEKFEIEIKNGKLVLLEGDILEFSITQTVSKFLSGPRISRSLSRPDHEKNLKPFSYKVIANIPYNITGAILKKFLTEANQPERMILMIQKEVAERVVARDGKESILSISVKAYGEPKLVMKVPARYFSPAPKVDSAIISINKISREKFIKNPIPEEKFWEIVKSGFAHKRKKLSGNLKGIISKEKLHELGFENERAEDLSLADWITLSKN